MSSTQVWFVRHGEVAKEAIGRFIGTSDVPLSDLGKHQGHAMAAYLEDAPIDAILSSPRKRSRETIAPLASKKGMIVKPVPGFAEMDFGHWENLTWDEIMARDPDYAPQWQADPGPNECPGGQSADGFCAGIQATLQETLEEFKGRSIVIAAHSGVNRAILAALTERPYIEMFRFAQDYGCMNAAAWRPDTWNQIALTNFVPGPRSQAPSW